MSNNDKKLDVISGIDEKIIDKCTRRKIALLTKLKIRTKRIIALTTSASVLCASLAAAFIVIWFNQVPVYTGMTLSRTNPMQNIADIGEDAVLLSTDGFAGALGGTNYEKGNILLDNNKDKDQSQNNGKDTFDAHGPKDIFYCRPGQDFYITVHIDNPKNYEILSFTLNGKKYSSYMFEEGSDMENLVLKCNLGADAFGLVEYTIDAIKYVDGTSIKDVRLKGEKTIKVGVYNPYCQPRAIVENIEKDYTSIKADITLKDEKNVLSYGKYELYAELLTDDGAVVSKKEITLGENKDILFEGIADGVTYKIQAVGYYDNFDGSGYSRHVIGSKSLITTKTALDVEITSTTFDSVSYSMTKQDGIEYLEVKRIYVTFDDPARTPAENTSVEGQSIIGLYSNTRYYLCIEYTFDGIDVLKEVKFKTAERSPLMIEITGATLDSVSFKVTDAHGLKYIEIRRAFLTHDDIYRTPVANTSVNGQTISGLRSGQNYFICVEYAVDGKIYTAEMPYSTPMRDPIMIKITDTSFDSVSYSVYDEHGLAHIEIRKVYVTLDDIDRTPVTNTSVNGQKISGLYSGRRYYLRIEYAVDGETLTVEAPFSTPARAEPVIELKNEKFGLTYVSFGLNIKNADGVTVKIKSVSIYDGDKLVAKQSASNSYTFKNLKAPKVYTVRVEYTVDKNDGNGANTKTVELSVVTQSEGLSIENGKIVGIGSCKDSIVYINMPIEKDAFAYCENIVAIVAGEGVYSENYLDLTECTSSIKYVFGIKTTRANTIMAADIDREYSEEQDGGYTVNRKWLDKTFTKDKNGYVTTTLNDGRKALVAYFGNAKDIVIPDGVKVIMSNTFRDFDIVSVKMSSTVTEICGGAFLSCESLETVVWSPNLTRIGPRAFSECGSLLKADLPSKVTEIGEGAFEACHSLETIIIPDGVTVLESNVFNKFGYGSETKTFVISKNLKVIKSCAVDLWCTGSEMIVLPSTLESIGAQGFCSGGSVFVPKSVQTVGASAFKGCQVYFEASEKPDNWISAVTEGAKSVVWGYKLN